MFHAISFCNCNIHSRNSKDSETKYWRNTYKFHTNLPNLDASEIFLRFEFGQMAEILEKNEFSSQEFFPKLHHTVPV